MSETRDIGVVEKIPSSINWEAVKINCSLLQNHVMTPIMVLHSWRSSLTARSQLFSQTSFTTKRKKDARLIWSSVKKDKPSETRQLKFLYRLTTRFCKFAATTLARCEFQS